MAALIRDASGRILLQQALPGKPHEGQWEFPGGKVESEENPRFALRREIVEELGLDLDERAMKPAGFADDDGGGGQLPIVLILYECSAWSGKPEAREGQTWSWFTLDEAVRLPMPGLDGALFARLLG